MIFIFVDLSNSPDISYLTHIEFGPTHQITRVKGITYEAEPLVMSWSWPMDERFSFQRFFTIRRISDLGMLRSWIGDETWFILRLSRLPNIEDHIPLEIFNKMPPPTRSLIWYLDNDDQIDEDVPGYFTELVHKSPEADAILERICCGHCFKTVSIADKQITHMSPLDWDMLINIKDVDLTTLHFYILIFITTNHAATQSKVSTCTK